MKLLEYEAKSLLSAAGVPVPLSVIADTTAAPLLPAVIKSQVPVGGRGKAGGIIIVQTADEYSKAIASLKTLPIKGFLPTTLLAEELLAIKQEFYLSLIIDRPAAHITLMAHRSGGIEVEDNNAEDFLTLPLSRPTLEQAGSSLAEYYDLPDKAFVLIELVTALYECFTKNDATLLEINPLILTTTGSIIAGDCKMECDDSAKFRHPAWAFEAGESEANFVTLDPQGTVATIANGAGLAMATVDAVADAGLRPANFLDIGGGATTDSVLAAFTRIMTYDNIQAIVINIFAGITRCDEVARAIIAARQQIDDLPPLCIRLAGTNFEEAAQLLADESIPVLHTLEACIERAKQEVSV